MDTATERLQRVIWEIERDHGLNATQLARALGITKSAVSKWANGANTSLRAEHALALEQRFGYAPRWLVLGLGPKRTDNLDVTLPGYASLTPENREAVRLMVSALLATQSTTTTVHQTEGDLAADC